MEPKKLVDIITEITENNKETLDNFIKNAESYNHKDRGVEGWFQTEIIAELQKQKIKVEHKHDGPDLIINEKDKIELKMTTCFNPSWTIDGMIVHGAPVLFFSGYLKYYKKDNPKFEEENAVEEWFQDRLTEKKKGKLKKCFGKTGLNIQYRTVDFGENKVIVGYIEPFKETSCRKI